MLDYRRFKEINDLFAAGKPEQARRLLMEMQSRCIALRDEVSMLKGRLQTFEDILYLSEKLYKENGFYWLKTANVNQGPFCPQCYESEGGLIRLDKNAAGLHCPYCNAGYASTTRGPAVNDDDLPIERARIIPFAR